MKRKLVIIAKQHEDGWVAYPARIKGVIVGQGETRESAVEDLRSAVKFHVATFGANSLDFEKDDLE